MNKIIKGMSVVFGLSLTMIGFAACGGKTDEFAEYTGVSTYAELQEAANNGEDIILEKDITFEEGAAQIYLSDLNVFGNNFTITHSGLVFQIDDGDVNIKSLDFEFGGDKSSKWGSDVLYVNGGNVSVDSCEINMDGSSSGTAITVWGGEFTITNSKLLGTTQGISVAFQNGEDATKVNIEKTEFENSSYAVFTSANYNDGVVVSIDDCKFTNCATFLSQQLGKIDVSNTTFTVGEKTNSDKNFKSTKTTLTINKTNKIVGDATKTDNVTIEN